MLAMSSYASSFNLTRQQDAAEAFLHLLSALEEEISENYMLHNSLAEIMCFPSKIYKLIREGQNECERWKQKFLGPFDGTIGSSLTCKSCFSMVASVVSSNSSKQCMYRLSSVVEHYGMPGTGHYAIYRRHSSELGATSSVRPSEAATCEWFYVSDRDVSVVSEETVIAAEASLLFYEMIDTNTCSD